MQHISMKISMFVCSIICVCSQTLSSGAVEKTKAPSSDRIKAFHARIGVRRLGRVLPTLDALMEDQEEPLEDFIVRYKECINTKSEFGNTALHNCVNERNQVSVELLLKHGAFVDIPNARGQVPLHLAATMGMTCFVELLIAAGASVNLQDEDGYTPLHYAVRNLHQEIVEILIKNNANLEVADNKGNTPLLVLIEDAPCIESSEFGSSESESSESESWYTLDTGIVDIEFPDNASIIREASTRPRPILSYEKSSLKQEVIYRCLSELSARMDKVNLMRETLPHKAVRRRNTRIFFLSIRKEPKLLGSMNSFLQTLLHYACQPCMGDRIQPNKKGVRLSRIDPNREISSAIREIVQYLIKECKKSCVIYDIFGNCPIHYWSSFRGSDLDTFKGAGKKVFWMTNGAGWTPLHIACFYNNLPLVIDLVAEARADQLNAIIPASGKDALMIACELGYDKVCDVLLSRKRCLKINREKTVGTALDWACEFGRNQLCEKFLKIEGFKNQRETDKIGLVRRASQLGNKDLVTLFVDTWDWNTIDDEGNTAVHIACLAGYADVVTVLLGKIGVVQMVKQQQNKKRKTVLDIARLKADPEILSVLSKYGVYS